MENVIGNSKKEVDIYAEEQHGGRQMILEITN